MGNWTKTDWLILTLPPLLVLGTLLWSNQSKHVSVNFGSSVSQASSLSGEELFARACATCHSVSEGRGRDGKVGPNLRGIYGNPVLLETGEGLIANEEYIRESLLEPRAKVVAGFVPAMPSFKGLLTDEEINHLVEYIIGLKEETSR